MSETKSGFKAGANFKDQNAIRNLAAKGLNAEEVSEQLHINLECVESFFPSVLTNDQKMEIIALVDDEFEVEEIAEKVDVEVDVVQAFIDTLSEE